MLNPYQRTNNNVFHLFDMDKQMLKRKIHLLNYLIYDPKSSFESHVSADIFQKLIQSKNVCIIGNGPIYCNISHLMDSFDFVIRFNNYHKDNDFNLLGRKIDLHIVCIPNINMDVIDSWIHDTCTPVVPFEICFPERYSFIYNNSICNKLAIPSKTYINNVLRLHCDCTRGFYGLSLCLKAKFLHNPKLKIHMIGFGGQGHHFKASQKINHDHESEKKIITYLKNQKILYDLNEYRNNPQIANDIVLPSKSLKYIPPNLLETTSVSSFKVPDKTETPTPKRIYPKENITNLITPSKSVKMLVKTNHIHPIQSPMLISSKKTKVKPPPNPIHNHNMKPKRSKKKRRVYKRVIT